MIGGYIIKPDGFQFRLEIRAKLLENGLNIFQYKIVWFEYSHINKLYPKLNGTMLELAIQHLTNGKSEIGLVKSDSVFEKLLKIGGQSTNPKLCEPDTIRYLFGSRETLIKDNYIYYLNAFHRTKNNEQTNRLINFFG